MYSNKEEAISQWCRYLIKEYQLSHLTVLELRDHLEYEIDRLVDQGILEQQAVRLAIQKMGDAKEISGEFCKNTTSYGSFRETWKIGFLCLCISMAIWVLLVIQLIPFAIFNVDLFDGLTSATRKFAELALLPTAFLIPAFFIGLGIGRCSELRQKQIVIGAALASAILVMTRLISFIPVPSSWDLSLAIPFKLMILVGGSFYLYAVVALSLSFGIRWGTKYLYPRMFAT